jgi:diguanylate cyclase (GGDEF)-like protein
MGYESGTELLRSVADRLRRICCAEQAGQSGTVGRFGADEFAILMPGIESESALTAFAEGIRSAMEEPFPVHARDLFLKSSFGVSWYPVHGRDSRTLFRCAEAALHRSMRSFNRDLTYYHREMRSRARIKFDLEAELRGALDDGQIRAWYQPQQCTRTGQISGIEALARWIRPDGSMVFPSDFIPLSEEMGVSDLLFEAILRSVCRDIESWRRESDLRVPVSVNLSAHQLRNAELVALVHGILDEFDMSRRLINFELTESALLEDLTIAQPLLLDLTSYGVGIHIDDFGTGYSSLSYLAQLPVEAIKIDRSFVSTLAENETTQKIVQAIVALGKALNLEVVAEGIETDRDYAIARRLGCGVVQGFFIGEPMPPERFLRWRNGYQDTRTLAENAAVVNIDDKR